MRLIHQHASYHQPTIYKQAKLYDSTFNLSLNQRNWKDKYYVIFLYIIFLRILISFVGLLCYKWKILIFYDLGAI